MGVFRIKQTRDNVFQDPTFDPYHLTAPEAPTIVVRPSMMRWLLLCASLALAIGCGAWWRAHLAREVAAADPYAYFEIKAIGPDGRAVAGATVTSAETPVGVTDSFGEWRRFVRVKLGSSLPLQLSKVQGGEAIAASRQLQIPAVMPETGALSIKGRIEMVRVASRPISKAKKSAPPSVVTR
ncbi:MAG: hypothetical protein NTZ90_10130 [Proteobacteria bacterium]|jgi:hypothetical protein|nr:hypothetical protein [Pseudomonadota bacterium]